MAGLSEWSLIATIHRVGMRLASPSTNNHHHDYNNNHNN